MKIDSDINLLILFKSMIQYTFQFISMIQYTFQFISMIQYTFIHNIILSLICYTYIFLIYKYKLTIKIIE